MSAWKTFPLAVVAACLMVGSCSAVTSCQPVQYGEALDICAMQNTGDYAGTRACQCGVAHQFGRSCAFLGIADDSGLPLGDSGAVAPFYDAPPEVQK